MPGDTGPREELVLIRQGQCWWCGAPADSREHRHKRSDLVREHGSGNLSGDATLSRISAEGRPSARSSRSKVLKFDASMCARCNNTRSQPFDNAYDEFIEHVWASEEAVLDDRHLDLNDLWGLDRPTRVDDLLRYYVKHICCRVADLVSATKPLRIPKDLIDFLDGGPPPRTLSYELTIEPVQLRMEASFRDDPLARRWIGFDDLFTSGEGLYSSVWRYGWLTFFWELHAPSADANHPLDSSVLPMPLFATQFGPGFEFAFARPGGAPAVDEESPAPVESDMHGLQTAGYFLAGYLDMRSELEGRRVDGRRNWRGQASGEVDSTAERALARRVAACCAAWGAGSFDADDTSAAAERAPLNVRDLQDAADRLGARAADDRPREAREQAVESLLKLLEAERIGFDDVRGQEHALESSYHAGACLATAAHEGGRPDAGYGSASLLLR